MIWHSTRHTKLLLDASMASTWNKFKPTKMNSPPGPLLATEDGSSWDSSCFSWSRQVHRSLSTQPAMYIFMFNPSTSKWRVYLCRRRKRGHAYLLFRSLSSSHVRSNENKNTETNDITDWHENKCTAVRKPHFELVINSVTASSESKRTVKIVMQSLFHCYQGLTSLCHIKKIIRNLMWKLSHDYLQHVPGFTSSSKLWRLFFGIWLLKNCA